MDVEEAVRKALESKPRKFVESIDLAINLQGVDLTKPQNRIDETIVLPKGLGKDRKIAAFCGGEMAVQAERMGIRVIPQPEIEKLAKDKKAAKKLAKDFDFFIAEAPLMPLIGRLLGPVLGPRGKMPIPIPPGTQLEPVVNRLKNTVRLRSKDKPAIHVCVGTRNMKVEDIAENIREVLSKIEGKMEKGAQNIKSVYIKTTMGSPVRIR